MSDPKPVLSEEQLRGIYYDGRNPTLLDALRAVERAVLEAVHPQCTDPIVGEHGHPLCGEVERLRARVAELERENTKWQDGHLARTVERDAALRELAEVRDALDIIESMARVGNEDITAVARAALDRAREGE